MRFVLALVVIVAFAPTALADPETAPRAEASAEPRPATATSTVSPDPPAGNPCRPTCDTA